MCLRARRYLTCAAFDEAFEPCAELTVQVDGVFIFALFLGSANDDLW